MVMKGHSTFSTTLIAKKCFQAKVRPDEYHFGAGGKPTTLKELTEKEVKKPWDPLERTRVPFGGVINELRKRFPLYKSDLLDALSPMCIAAVIFIFFAALSGAIAFGGLYGRA